MSRRRTAPAPLTLALTALLGCRPSAGEAAPPEPVRLASAPSAAAEAEAPPAGSAGAPSPAGASATEPGAGATAEVITFDGEDADPELATQIRSAPKRPPLPAFRLFGARGSDGP